MSSGKSESVKFSIVSIINSVVAEYRSALQMGRDAAAVIKRASEITSPKPAADKAVEAKKVAQQVQTVASQVQVTWDALSAKTNAEAAQVDAAKIMGLVVRAEMLLAEAQERLAEAEQLSPQAEDDETVIKRLRVEIVEFRDAAGKAEDAVKDIAGKIREQNKLRSTSATKAAVRDVGNLETTVHEDYRRARKAEDDADEAETRADVETAHATAKKASEDAARKARSAQDRFREIGVTDQPLSTQESVLQRVLADITSFVILGLSLVVVGFVCVFFDTPKPIAIIIASFVIVAVIWALIQPPQARRMIAVSLLTLAVVVLGVSYALREMKSVDSDASKNGQPTATVPASRRGDGVLETFPTLPPDWEEPTPTSAP